MLKQNQSRNKARDDVQTNQHEPTSVIGWFVELLLDLLTHEESVVFSLNTKSLMNCNFSNTFIPADRKGEKRLNEPLFSFTICYSKSKNMSSGVQGLNGAQSSEET